MNGWARVAGSRRIYRIGHLHSHVEIGSLDRHQAVYRLDAGLPVETDDALELASYMESPNAGAAIIGAWSAVEALLIRPAEYNKSQAADRLAALVACSLPRAELTDLCVGPHRGAHAMQTRLGLSRGDGVDEQFGHVERHAGLGWVQGHVLERLHQVVHLGLGVGVVGHRHHC